MEIKKFLRFLYFGRERRGGGGGTIWLTIYSDMMTNLMLFFLLLYALTRIDEKDKELAISAMRSTVTGKEMVHVAQLDEQKADEVVEDIKQAGELADLEIDEKRIKITLRSPVLFASGSFNLSAETKKLLKQIATIIRDVPNKVLVEGHTDNIPVLNGTNWQLSIKRAASVVYYFVNDEELPRDKFIVAGYGESKPVVPNDTEENRAKNRRIEINVIKYE